MTFTHSVVNQRETNEDSVFCDFYRIVVADGMGGHARGEVASKVLVDKFVEMTEFSFRDIDGRLNEFATIAGQVVTDAAQFDSGSTFTGGVIFNSELYVLHCGDSALFILRDGVCKRYTQEQNVWGVAHETSGRLTDVDNKHRLLSCVMAGGSTYSVHWQRLKLDIKAGDLIFAASDGFIARFEREDGTLDLELLAGMMGACRSSEDFIDLVVEAAAHTGNNDNATLAVIEV